MESGRQRQTTKGRKIDSFPFSNHQDKVVLPTEWLSDFFLPQKAEADGIETVAWAGFLRADALTEQWLYDYGGAPGVQNSTSDSSEAGLRTQHTFFGICYGKGFQILTLEETGAARELLSTDYGVNHQMALLSSPSHAGRDLFSKERPLVALFQPEPEKCHGVCNSVSFYSLFAASVVKTLQFSAEVIKVQSNSRVVAVATRLEILLLNAASLSQSVIKVSSVQLPFNALTLGDRWLAFADHELHGQYASIGGLSEDQQPSYTAAVLSAAKSSASVLGRSLSAVGGMIGRFASSTHPEAVGYHRRHEEFLANDTGTAVVTIVDTAQVRPLTANDTVLRAGQSAASVTGQCDYLLYGIAHFTAHLKESISLMEFDHSGSLLVTCGTSGRYFNVYRIDNQSPSNSCQTVVHHLYTLFRGDTTAVVLSASFSLDARWLSVTTEHGTAHVFALLPFGGLPVVSTHQSVMSNKLTPYQASMGLTSGLPVGQATPPVARHVNSAPPTQSDVSSSVSTGVTGIECLATGHPRLGFWLANSLRHSIIPCVRLEPVAQLKPASHFSVTPVDSASSPPGAVQSNHSWVAQLACATCLSAAFAPHQNTDDDSNVGNSFNIHLLSSLHGLIRYSISVPSSTTPPAPTATPDVKLPVTACPQAVWNVYRSSTHPLVQGNPPTPAAANQSRAISVSDAASSQKNLSWTVDSAASHLDNERCLSHFRPITSSLPYRLLVDGPHFILEGEKFGATTSGDNQGHRADNTLLVRGPWPAGVSSVECGAGQPNEKVLEDLQSAMNSLASVS